MRLSVILGIFGFVLAGCGSSGSDLFDAATFEGVATSVDTQVASEGFTSAANLPATGSASYRGYVAVVPNPKLLSANVGNARLNADFGAGDISMTSDGFAKYEITATGDDISLDDVRKVEDVSGSLSMTDGAISNNAFGEAVFTGIVTGVVDSLGYTVPVDGLFVGDDADALVAAGTQQLRTVIIEAIRD